ncbi:hypothetical protein EW146_g5906 [Bondarzewia mesenterica]|uniref:Uncharacterized protein n=1 Tax=Bondarzewia mesenterica TaxID=1095465 RepID=A0A4S4LR41_9AGAM|nr:hypothetical protein EW146_g5906 [Bondarzewia mesenterica]
MYSPRPILHHVSDASEWPSPVRHISQLLQHPLPASLAVGPHPFVSDMASGLLQELSCSPLLHTERDDSEIPDSRPLSDVLNIVLSTVCGLRVLVKEKDYCGHVRPTLPLWFSMLKVLGCACSEDLSVMGETPFILSRVRPHEPHQPEVLDGKATMLISHTVDRVQPPCPQIPMNAEDAGKDAGNDHSAIMGSQPPVVGVDTTSYSEHEDENMTEDTDDSSSKTSSTPSLDMPLDAHMLPGCGRRFFAILPIICVADEENIISLLTSVLYQRQVWGIDEPVVGLVLSKHGVVGQLFLGWLDLTSADEQHLPTAHFACAAASTAVGSATIGVFDLTDPASALALAQFVFGLKSHVRTITATAMRPHIDDLSWRGDRVATKDGQDEGEWRDRIVNWAREIDMASRDGSSRSETPSSSSSSYILVDYPNMPPRSKPSQKSLPAISEKRATRPDEHVTPATSHRESESKRDDSKKEDKSEAPSIYSCSIFAQRNAKDATDDRLTINTWMFERKVCTIGRIPLKSNEPDRLEINAMINLTTYRKLTHICNPITMTFFRQHDGARAVKTPGVLDPVVADIVVKRLPLILLASAGAYTHQVASKGRNVYEVEWRHNWDALLYHFYVASADAISSDSLLEHTLTLSRNDTVDITDPALLASVEDTFAEYNDNLSSSAYTAASSLQDEARTHALNALIRAAKMRQQVQTLASDPATMMQTIQTRAAPEPRTGKCDAILVMPIFDVLGERIGSSTVQESLPENFAFVQRAKDSGNGGRATIPVSDQAPKILSTRLSSATNQDSSKKVDELGYLLDIFRCSDFYAKSTHTPISGVSLTQAPLIDSRTLLLPTLVAEYKKQDSVTKPINQGRMYLVSAVTFLAAVGITNYPVFGLVTDGAEGVVTLAWYSETQDKIYVMERNVCKLLLSSPLHAFQFATFLVRLRNYNQDLRALFEDKKELFMEKARKGELRSWSKAAQALSFRSSAGDNAGGDFTIAVDNARRSSEEEGLSGDLSVSNDGANSSDDNKPTKGASPDDGDNTSPSETSDEPDDPKDLDYEPGSG